MQLDQLVNDALMFAAGALVLVLIAQFFGTPRRRGLLPMLVVVAAGVAGLWMLDRYAASIKSALVATILREAALGLVAFGTFQIAVRFVFQTLLARRGIPRILDEFVIALSLIGYAIFRLNAIGVNLAGLITTSAVLTGAMTCSANAPRPTPRYTTRPPRDSRVSPSDSTPVAMPLPTRHRCTAPRAQK